MIYFDEVITELRADNEKLRGELAAAEAVRLRLLERLSHSALSEVVEAAPGYLDPRGLHPVLAERDSAARKEALREAARVAEQWGETNEVGGYTRAAFMVAVAIRERSEEVSA